MKILEKKYIQPLYKIKDFAEFIGSTVDTLLFYEKVNLFLPFKKDEATHYRYYSVSQLSEISKIIQLKNLGLTLSEIKQFLQGNFTFGQKIEMVQEKIDNLEKLKNLFTIFEKKPFYSAYVKEVNEHIAFSIKIQVKKSSDILFVYENLMNEFLQKKIKIKQPYHFYTKYYDTEFKFFNNDIEVFAEILTPNENTKLIPKQKFVCTLHYGNYNDLPKAYNFLYEYCKKSSLQIIDFPIEQYIESYGSKNLENEFITEIMLPIK